MSIQTRSQRLAQAAYQEVARQGAPDKGPDKEYAGFAKKFPALIHTCGLAQAVAFALAKRGPSGRSCEWRYLDGLAKVLAALGHQGVGDPESLDRASREVGLSEYVRLSRNAIEAASWMKRYAEALAEDQ